nr:cholinesterase 1-like [Rhipicephalus microplus]
MSAMVIVPFFLALVSTVTAFDVQTVTALGVVGGSRTNVLGRPLEVYRGIPYAQPPMGALRFRPPEPLQGWDGVLNATNRRTACPQVIVAPVMTEGALLTEDCLHLNVWSPVAPKQAPVPVLVSIHGGGFSHGSASIPIFDGAVLAAKTGLVVVSLNYRLDILGFLDANSTEAPGNVGLMDQALALKWIQAHIHHFGGDPLRVTIFGVSAGGMSAHAHVISPMSRGLFKRACLMSGTLNSPDFVEHVTDSINKGNLVARAVGCADSDKNLTSDPESVVACLRTKSADELVQASSHSIKPKIFTFLPTYPNRFLPKDPAVAVKEGSFNSADIIVGVTKDEGMGALMYPPRQELWTESLEGLDEEFFNKTLHDVIFSWFKTNSENNLSPYIAEARDRPELRRAYVDFLSDRTFVCPMHFTAEGHSKRGHSVYSYVFSYHSAKSTLPAWMGTPHGGDVSYIYGFPLVDQEKYDAEMSSCPRIWSTCCPRSLPQEYPNYLWRSNGPGIRKTTLFPCSSTMVTSQTSSVSKHTSATLLERTREIRNVLYLLKYGYKYFFPVRCSQSNCVVCA